MSENEYNRSVERKLEGQKIVKAQVDGGTVVLALDNGYVFRYDASDGGYSTYEVVRKEE